MVLWGHSIQYLQSVPFYENAVYRIIYSFHMPLFMMISGYFSISSMSLSLLTFIKKKGFQLLVPAVIWSIIVWGVNASLGNHQSIFFHIVEDYWFLKSLFVCYSVCWLGQKTKMKLWQWGLLTIIFTQFIEIYKISLMYPCFFIGYVLRFKDLSGFISKRNVIAILACVFIISLFFWDQSFWDNIASFKRAVLLLGLGELDWSWFYYRYFPYFIGIIGSLFFIGLFLKLQFFYDGKGRFCRMCADWGSKTMGIYLIQLVLLETVLPHYVTFDSINLLFPYNFIITPMIASVILFLCVVIIKILEKSKPAQAILLGKTE